jgi:hypothetical protein
MAAVREADAPSAAACPLCGSPTECGVVAGGADCWCAAIELPVELAATLARGAARACVCAKCVAAARLARAASSVAVALVDHGNVVLQRVVARDE